MNALIQQKVVIKSALIEAKNSIIGIRGVNNLQPI